MIIPYKKELVQTITRFCVSKYNNLFKMSKTPFRVAVEGNIGAGKSTLIDYYKSYPNVDVYPVSCYYRYRLFVIYEFIKCNYLICYLSAGLYGCNNLNIV